jgi:hypothetical protein
VKNALRRKQNGNEKAAHAAREDYVSKVEKALFLWSVPFVVGLYCVFVMQQLWNWFAVPLLHFSEASFLTMYGLNLFVGLVTARDLPDPMEEYRWKILMLTVDACVPAPVRGNLLEELKDEIEWRSWGVWVFGTAMAYTVTLGIGFIVHRFT